MKMTIGGRCVDGKKKIEVKEDHNESVLDTVPSRDENDVKTALDSAEGGCKDNQ